MKLLWLALAAAALAPFVVVAQTLAPTPAPCGDDCGPNDVTPRLRCACRLNADEVYAQFEYTNTNANTIFIAAGTARNYVTPGAASQGQPSSFAPGTHAAQSLIFNCTAHPTGVAWVIQQSHVASASASCVSIPCDSDGQCGRCDGQNVATFVTDTDVEEGDLVRLVHNTTDQQRAHVRRLYSAHSNPIKSTTDYITNFVTDSPYIIVQGDRQSVAPNGDSCHVIGVLSFDPTFHTLVVNGTDYELSNITRVFEPPGNLYSLGPGFQAFFGVGFMIVSHLDDSVVHFELAPSAPFYGTLNVTEGETPILANFTSTTFGRCIGTERANWFWTYERDTIQSLEQAYFSPTAAVGREAHTVVRKYDSSGVFLREVTVRSGVPTSLAPFNGSLFEPNPFPVVAGAVIKTRSITRLDGSVSEYLDFAGYGIRPITVGNTTYLGPVTTPVFTSAVLLTIGDSQIDSGALALYDATVLECTKRVEQANEFVGTLPGTFLGQFAGAGIVGMEVAPDGSIIVIALVAGRVYVPDSSENGRGSVFNGVGANRLTLQLGQRIGVEDARAYYVMAKYEPSTRNWAWMQYLTGAVYNDGIQPYPGTLAVQRETGRVLLMVYYDLKLSENPNNVFRLFANKIHLPIHFRTSTFYALGPGNFIGSQYNPALFQSLFVFSYKHETGDLTDIASFDGAVENGFNALVVAQNDDVYVSMLAPLTLDMLDQYSPSLEFPIVFVVSSISDASASTGTGAVVSGSAPPNWGAGMPGCDPSFYGAGDGCDCQCGVGVETDPDCLPSPFISGKMSASYHGTSGSVYCGPNDDQMPPGWRCVVPSYESNSLTVNYPGIGSQPNECLPPYTDEELESHFGVNPGSYFRRRSSSAHENDESGPKTAKRSASMQLGRGTGRRSYTPVRKMTAARLATEMRERGISNVTAAAHDPLLVTAQNMAGQTIQFNIDAPSVRPWLVGEARRNLTAVARSIAMRSAPIPACTAFTKKFVPEHDSFVFTPLANGQVVSFTLAPDGAIDDPWPETHTFPPYFPGDIVQNFVVPNIYTSDGTSNGTSTTFLGDQTLLDLRRLGYKKAKLCMCPAWCGHCKDMDTQWGATGLSEPFYSSYDTTDIISTTGLTSIEKTSLGAQTPSIIVLSGVSQVEIAPHFSSDYSIAEQQWIALNKYETTNLGAFNDSGFQITSMFEPNPNLFPWCAWINLMSGQWLYGTGGYASRRETCVALAMEASAYDQLPRQTPCDLGSRFGCEPTPPTYAFVPVIQRLNRDLAPRETQLAPFSINALYADHQGNVIGKVLPGFFMFAEEPVIAVQLGEGSDEDQLIGRALTTAPAGSAISVSFPTPEQPSPRAFETPGGRLWADDTHSTDVEFRGPGARMTGVATETHKFIGRSG